MERSARRSLGTLPPNVGRPAIPRTTDLRHRDRPLRGGQLPPLTSGDVRRPPAQARGSPASGRSAASVFWSGTRRMRDTLADQDGLYTLTLTRAGRLARFSVIGSIRRLHLRAGRPRAACSSGSCRPRRASCRSRSPRAGTSPTRRRDACRSTTRSCSRRSRTGSSAPRTAFGWIVAALRERRARGIEPFAVLSCDNIQGNGRVARLSVEGVARLVDEDLADWIAASVAFPSTMVDRITPATTRRRHRARRVGAGRARRLAGRERALHPVGHRGRLPWRPSAAREGRSAAGLRHRRVRGDQAPAAQRVAPGGGVHRSADGLRRTCTRRSATR